MARLVAKVSRSEVSPILKNTFFVGIFWWNRPHTSFLGLIGYMVHSGTELFRTKTLLNFASKALSNSVFQKSRFRFEFLYQIAPHLFSSPNGLDGMIGGKSVPEWNLTHPKKHFLIWNFLMKPAPYLFSGPNWLYGAFGDKIVPDENFAQFCLKSPLEFVFPINTFSAWIFVLNRTSPILWAKQTRWRNWGKSVPERSFVHPKNHVFGRNFLTKPAPYLFSGPNWLYGAFGRKIVPDDDFAQFCLKGPLEFVYPINTFSVWIFVLNRTSPIFMAKRTSWRDWGHKCPGAKFRPS